MTSLLDTIDGPRIQHAAHAISPFIRKTPCLMVPELGHITSVPVYLKLENLQYTGAFKIRGNAYKLSTLSDEELAAGVVTASSGNHGLGLSLSALRRSVSAVVVVPMKTPQNKMEKLKEYRANVLMDGETYHEAVSRAMAIAQDTGARYISSFDDPDIITGNATMGLEIFQAVPNLRLIISPIGGGGGISGIALALKALSPSVRIIGVQAKKAASMVSSLAAGRRRAIQEVDTLADGIAVKEPGRLTFPLVQRLVDDVVVVSDEEMKEAAKVLLQRARVVSELAGSASVAALKKIQGYPSSGSIVCLISGGNIDTQLLTAILCQSEKGAGD